MHEKILQGVTIGVVGGLIVYWLTSVHHADKSGRSAAAHDYKPTYGDIRSIRNGIGTDACCNCCGLGAPENVAIPLASDYLCCAPPHAAAISDWNIGVSLQLSCQGFDLDAIVHRNETATSFPHGLGGPDSTPKPIRLRQPISCNPNVPVTIECTEVI
jgi:hypothetical protein